MDNLLQLAADPGVWAALAALIASASTTLCSSRRGDGFKRVRWSREPFPAGPHDQPDRRPAPQVLTDIPFIRLCLLEPAPGLSIR
jgi:hypothetical protein